MKELVNTQPAGFCKITDKQELKVDEIWDKHIRNEG
jgi:hypothetical protein